VLAAYDSADQHTRIDVREWTNDRLETVGAAPAVGVSMRPIQEKEEQP
jgi:hypothetical protein